MRLSDLYEYADNCGIPVISFEMPESESISMSIDGQCYVGIDPYRLRDTCDEKVKLAHELGHCETGAFYNEYSAYDVRSKHEHTAEKWAIKKLVPKDELIQACKNWCTNSFELAEHFGVPQWFIDKAIALYFD